MVVNEEVETRMVIGAEPEVLRDWPDAAAKDATYQSILRAVQKEAKTLSKKLGLKVSIPSVR